MNFIHTHHISQEESVLCVILVDENKSRKSPSLSFLSSLGNFSITSGIFLPLTLATLHNTFLASTTRPFFKYQRKDSGIDLSGNKKQIKNRLLRILPFGMDNILYYM